MALLACLLGYGEVGLWLKRLSTEPGTWVNLDHNPYQRWIEDYSGSHYQAAVKIGMGEQVVFSTFLITFHSQKRSKKWLAAILLLPNVIKSGAKYGKDVHCLREAFGIWQWTAIKITTSTLSFPQMQDSLEPSRRVRIIH